MSNNSEDNQSLNDRLAIIEVLSNYATGLDARDWQLWRSVFVDEVVFDLSSWSKQPARTLQTDRVVRSQARIFAELVVTQHFITNHRVSIDGDRARCLAHMRAEHWIVDDQAIVRDPAIACDERTQTSRYTMFGYYDDKLVRTSEGWKIREMQLNVTHTEGPRWVMAEAVRRASAKR